MTSAYQGCIKSRANDNLIKKLPMNSYERVVSALRGEVPDRVPCDLGSSLVTGITRGAYLDLAEELTGHNREATLYDVAQQLARVDEDILQRLGVDTRALIPNIVRKSPPVEREGEDHFFTDEWGLRWKRPAGGLYFDVISHPLGGDIDEDDIEDFNWPDPTDESLIEGLAEKAERFRRDGRAVMLESLCAGIFEMCCRMRGTEQFCMDLLLNPSLACALMDKFVELKVKFYEMAAAHLSGHVQFIREGDDVAGQESLIISPDTYRQHLKPRHARIFEAQRSLFDEPFFVFFHSDGAVRELIPDFIEAGVDVLNPVQTNAKDMDPGGLKEEFGSDIAFWGAAVDPPVLTRGTPEEIQDQVREHVRALAPGGGYLFGAVHNIQDDVPAENILAMWEAFEEVRTS